MIDENVFIPPIIKDMLDKLSNPKTGSFEKQNISIRLIEIKKAIDKGLKNK